MLGELALRVNDVAAMRAFYRDVVASRCGEMATTTSSLRSPRAWKVTPQALVLFDRGVEVGPEMSTLDHLAFVIDLDDYEARRRQLERLGLRVTPKEFPLFHWRALFIEDPEGNTVEFVCYDPSV